MGIKCGEKVTCISKKHKTTLPARIDTGAAKSSIDTELAEKLGLEVVGKRTIRNVFGRNTRNVVKLKVEIGGKTMQSLFTIADRQHMSYHILIGRNILKKGFLIDPSMKLKISKGK